MRSALLLSILLCSGCGSPTSASTKPAPTVENKAPRKVVLDAETLKRLGITTMKIGEGTASVAIGVPGSIEYDLAHFAEVGPRLDGRVLAVHTKLGEKVKKGDVLADMAVPTLAEAQASALTASASLAAAKKNAAREKDLLDKGLTTAREWEVAEADLAKANAEVAAAGARLQALGVNAGGVGGAIRLVSPIDGVVVQRSAVLGGFLAMSSNAFAIADIGKLQATLDVHEADLPYLELGSDVSFNADGLPARTFKGKLTFVEPTVSKTTRLVRARMQVDNPDGTLRPGMFIRALIMVTTRPVNGAIPVPPQAVQPLGADDVAFVEKSPGTYEIRKLKLGRRTSEVIEVLDGVALGETIVVEGAFLLRGEAAKQ